MNALEKRSVVALASVYAMRMLGLFMVMPVFVLLGSDLKGATPALIGFAIGAYGLSQALLQIPFGLLSDRVGRKRMIYIGLVLFAAGSVLAGATDSIYVVIAGRILQGAGAIASVLMALLSDLTREEQRTKAMATVGISIGLSFSVSLVVGPLLGAARDFLYHGGTGGSGVGGGCPGCAHAAPAQGQCRHPSGPGNGQPCPGGWPAASARFRHFYPAFCTDRAVPGVPHHVAGPAGAEGQFPLVVLSQRYDYFVLRHGAVHYHWREKEQNEAGAVRRYRPAGIGGCVDDRCWPEPVAGVGCAILLLYGVQPAGSQLAVADQQRSPGRGQGYGHGRVFHFPVLRRVSGRCTGRLAAADGWPGRCALADGRSAGGLAAGGVNHACTGLHHQFCGTAEKRREYQF